MTNAVEIENLCKKYGKLHALNNIILNVPEGTIYGLIGPNGAGKTTLIKALVGALKPTGGSVKVLGLDPLRDKWKLRPQIGYMPQSPALYDDLSAKRNILFFGGAKKVLRGGDAFPANPYPAFDGGKQTKTNSLARTCSQEIKATEILEFAELTTRANDLVRTFSGGMKKRVSLCCALIHQPRIVFLDEPTAAIDPHLKLLLWKLFRQLANKGVTLFISTHLMDEALLCDKVAILRDGEILTVDTPQKILERGKTLLKIYENGELKESIIDSTPEAIAKELQRFGLKQSISSITIHPDSIEDIVLAIIREKEKTLDHRH
ncbi:MAG: ABC transporter ATP-binding protein [Candidatus Stahlbacteria bacterium]|nr:ABC transporter ATP-binding protein [Candidatus Stahlbacteria bacterium]